MKRETDEGKRERKKNFRKYASGGWTNKQEIFSREERIEGGTIGKRGQRDSSHLNFLLRQGRGYKYKVHACALFALQLAPPFHGQGQGRPMISHSTPIILLFPFDCTMTPLSSPPALRGNTRARFSRAINTARRHILALVARQRATGWFCYARGIISFPIFHDRMTGEFELVRGV